MTAATQLRPAPQVGTAAETAAPLLEVKWLFKSFGGIQAVRDVSFDVQQREILGLIGPNGSGKTTVLNLIAGFYQPDAGEVLFGGTNLVGFSPSRIAQSGLVRSWQDPRIVASISVRENVQLGSLANRRSKAPVDIDQLLATVGIADIATTVAGNLPYGKQKLAAFARTLAAGPKMLVLDEPLAGLADNEKARLVEVIQDFRRQGTVLIVDHAFGVMSRLCDRVIVLNAGAKLAEGTPDAVARNREVIEVYFG